MQTKEKTPKKDQALKVMPVKKLVKQPLRKTKGNAFLRLECGAIGKSEAISVEVVLKGRYVNKQDLDKLKKKFTEALDELDSYFLNAPTT